MSWFKASVFVYFTLILIFGLMSKRKAKVIIIFFRIMYKNIIA